ncbi:MAG: hypothetical protein RL181_2784 [Bacteroidota bacterium]|jgi:O-antigen/teichoic acid export membrane protein
MSLLKKLAGETVVYGLSSILGRLLNYVILTPYLTRVFTNRAEYGVVTELYAYIALLMVFFTYRMETTFFRYGSRKEDAERTFSTASIAIVVSSIVLSALFIGFSGPISRWMDYPEHPEYIVLFTLILAFDAVSAIPFARLRLENRPVLFAFIRIANIAFNIFFIFFFLEICPLLARQGWTFADAFYEPSNRVMYVFLSNLIASAGSFLFLLPLLFRMQWKLDVPLLKTMLAYAGPLVIAAFAGAINQFIGNPMLKYFTPGSLQDKLVQLGLFGAAAKIPILMTLFTQAFNYAAEPFFFRHAQREDSRAIYAQVAQAFTLVGCFAFTGIMLYLDVIAVLIGPNYRAAVGIVPILLIAYLFLGIFYNFSIWFKLADKTTIGGYMALGGAAITVVLNVLLIPHIGYYGPAWAALACYAFMIVVCYWTGQRYYPIEYPIGRMALYLLMALGAYAFGQLNGRWFSNSLVWKLAANTLVFLLFSGMVLWVERGAVAGLLRRFRRLPQA